MPAEGKAKNEGRGGGDAKSGARERCVTAEYVSRRRVQESSRADVRESLPPSPPTYLLPEKAGENKRRSRGIPFPHKPNEKKNGIAVR